MGTTPGSSYDCSFKVLLIGDSAVGKSSLLVSFVSAAPTDDDISPTIAVQLGSLPRLFQLFLPKHLFYPNGVDFKIKFLTVGDKKLKLTIWDTAGQERFRTITSSYYRGAHGIILVYDVTKRQSFTNLADVWAKEIELHSTNKECVKMLVGNKVDKDEDRMVTTEEGLAFAQQCGCLFLESSAKTRENVEKCFEELVLKILEVPSLSEEGSSVVKRNSLKQKHEKSGGCCQ
nr:ras-related protein RABC2a isoform X1 [Aegilops tauschii subsp. strangulata]